MAPTESSSRTGRVLHAWLDFWFRPVDSRIYAINRAIFAAVVLINIAEIWPYRQILLAREGMIDRSTLMQAIGSDYYLSVFHYWDSQTAVTAFCAMAALAACALGLGILPRVAAILVWAWSISVSHRAFPAMTGWDNLVRVYSFLMMISPLGGQWNAWRYLKRAESIPWTLHHSPQYGLQLMRLQLTVVYFATVWSKLNDPYWRSGELFAYFMRSIYSRFPDTHWENHMILSCLFTYGTLVIESTVPILLWNKRTRWLGFAFGYSLHLGIAVLARLSVFSITIMAAYFSFLDDEILARIENWWRSDARNAREHPPANRSTRHVKKPHHDRKNVPSPH